MQIVSFVTSAMRQERKPNPRGSFARREDHLRRRTSGPDVIASTSIEWL